MNNLGIYIHIPFCKSKCYYCNFNSYSCMDDKIEKYIKSLETEILNYTEIYCQYNISTIYFGGGTPSYINEKYIIRILNLLKSCCNILKDAEITIEINPGTVDYNKMLEYKKIGINRISIGLQDTNNDILKSIGRVHTYEDYLETIDIVKKLEFKNISTDIIYGLPGQTKNSIVDSLKKIIQLEIPHISVYGLEIHEDSKLDFLLKNNFLKLNAEDEDMEIKYALENFLKENEYNRYEISNYSKKNYESKHNLNYWLQGNYIGFGAGASSYLLSTRYTNIENIDKYITGIENGLNIHTEIEEMDLLDTMKEYCILQLRLQFGINTKCFYTRFKKDIFDIYAKEINNLINDGLLIHNNNNIYLSDKGKDLANLVWEQFI